MMELIETLFVESSDEIGQLKAPECDLYVALLELMNWSWGQNEEIIKLEKLKFDFFRGLFSRTKNSIS